MSNFEIFSFLLNMYDDDDDIWECNMLLSNLFTTTSSVCFVNDQIYEGKNDRARPTAIVGVI